MEDGRLDMNSKGVTECLSQLESYLSLIRETGRQAPALSGRR